MASTANVKSQTLPIAILHFLPPAWSRKASRCCLPALGAC